MKHFSWVNIVREVQCLDFRRISLPLPHVDLKEIDIFTALLVGQPKPRSKYEFEKKRSKGGEILSSNAPPLLGYE